MPAVRVGHLALRHPPLLHRRLARARHAELRARDLRGPRGLPLLDHAVPRLVERFDIELFSDFSQKKVKL